MKKIPIHRSIFLLLLNGAILLQGLFYFSATEKFSGLSDTPSLFRFSDIDERVKGTLDCKGFLHDYLTGGNMHNISNFANDGKSYFRRTTTEPPFYISLHNSTTDFVRWTSIMDKGYYYELAMYTALKEALQDFKENPRDAIVLDVGGNIGWYSLLAASLGHRVVTVEPNPINNIRLCESLQMNGWLHENHKRDLVEIYQGGAGDKHGSELHLYEYAQKLNPGMATFKPESKRRAVKMVASNVSMMSLDGIAKERGWFDSRPNIAFVKVDVEGFELNVLKGATEMIKAGLIRNVVFEFKPQNGFDGDNISLLKTLIGSNYVLYKAGRYSGPRSDFKKKYETGEELYNILSEARHNQNLWWKLKV